MRKDDLIMSSLLLEPEKLPLSEEASQCLQTLHFSKYRQRKRDRWELDEGKCKGMGMGIESVSTALWSTVSPSTHASLSRLSQIEKKHRRQ